MAISYPIDATSTIPTPRSVTLTYRRITGVSESPFTFNQQVYSHQGARWEMDMTFAPMTRTDFAAFHAFLMSLRGRYGTFYYYADPAESGGSDGALSGSHAARATTITTQDAEDWTAGKLIGIDDHLYRVVGVNSTTSFDIEPGLRAAYTDGEAVDGTKPRGIWRLASDEITYSIDVAQFHSITIPCVEAL